MPLYEYFCPDNGTRLAVRHTMAEKLRTWGQVCERLGMHHGDTPPEAPVERQTSGGTLLLKRRSGMAGHSCPDPNCCS